MTQPLQKSNALPSPPILGGAGLRAFFTLAEHWGLNPAAQRKLLGAPTAATFDTWKRRQEGFVNQEALERISYLLGIYKDLQRLFPDPAQADAWIHRPNQAAGFGGQSALQRMLSGQIADLQGVRQYLDAVCNH